MSADWEGFFKAWDKDSSGTLELKEIVSMMTSEPLNLSKEDAEKNAKLIMDETDKNADGKITFDEFMAVMKKAGQE